MVYLPKFETLKKANSPECYPIKAYNDARAGLNQLLSMPRFIERIESNSQS